jgi:hypothetical protein
VPVDEIPVIFIVVGWAGWLVARASGRVQASEAGGGCGVLALIPPGSVPYRPGRVTSHYAAGLTDKEGGGMDAVIVDRRSALYETAVGLYVRHQLGEGGWCLRCRRFDCPVRGNAAAVIRAAGGDPGLYEPPPRRPEATFWADQQTMSLPVYGVESHADDGRSRGEQGLRRSW